MWENPLDTIVILEDGPLTRCEACNMSVTHYALQNGHRNSEQCVRVAETKKKRAIKDDPRLDSDIVFTIKGIPIENVRDFIYINTSGKAGAQILHLPLGDDSSPSGDNTVGRYHYMHYTAVCNKSLTATYQCTTSNGK
jgi:hypothetical protein